MSELASRGSVPATLAGALLRRSRQLGALTLFACIVGMVPAQVATAAATPKVVLDPDDDYAFGLHDGITYHGLPIQHDIALRVQATLPSTCAADIVITRDTFPLMVAPAARAAQMLDADLSVTLSLNSNDGVEWGTPADGGSSAFATNVPANLAFGTELTNQMGAFTGRPTTPVNEEQTGGRVYPYPEFAALPGTYAQFFMMFIDHAVDWVVIRDGRTEMVNAIVTAIANTLQRKGFRCLGAFPPRPSAARLAQLRNLGYQRFLRYNAEPISMSTGNFSTAEEIFSLPGVGDQAIDLTLNYNAQSAQDSPIGHGWQFAYGSYLQQYSDGTVAVFLPDGRALAYSENGSGGFTSPAGAFAKLEQPGDSTFVWTTKTGSSMTFEQDAAGRGRLTATGDRRGNAETLTYNGSGVLFPKLASITDAAGQTVDVATDADGRITRFTRPDGAVWKLAYSSEGDLVTVTSPLGSERRHVYDGQHRITSQVGQDGVTFLRNAYDDKSRVVEQHNATGQTRRLAYDDAAESTTYTDAAGATTTYHWNALGQVTEIRDALNGSRRTSYNAETLPATEMDPLGKTTTMSYDASGQLASQTDPLGSVVSSTYNGNGDRTSTRDAGGSGGAARTVSFALNGDGLPLTITNPDGTSQRRTYDGSGDLTSSTDENGAVTTYALDGRGNVRRVTDPLGRATTMTYDAANRVTSATDPLGRITTYAYDSAGKLTRTTYADGSTERRTYDVNDQLESVTDRRGGVTRYGRDAELNVTTITLPNGGVVRNTFDGESRQTSTTDPLGNTTTYGLDELGRRILTTDARGNKTKTTYDANGRIVGEEDPTGARTTYALDAVGRPTTVTDPAGGRTGLSWDPVGRRVAVTDQRGKTSRRTYDFRDQVVSETDAAGGVTTNAYDTVGRLISTTDPAGARTRFAYDAAGQLLTMADARGGVTSYAYDAAGNRTRVTDPNGHKVTTEYDVTNRAVRTIDANGNATTLQRDQGGLVTESRDPLGHRTRFSYDAMGDRVATTDPLGRTSATQYDLDQRPTAEVAADGVVTQRRYDAVGNLTGLIRNRRVGEAPGASTNVNSSFGYDARNLLSTATDPNGAATTFGYDVRGLLTSETDPLGRATRNTYDAAGNLASRTDARGVVTSVDYDARNLALSRAYSDDTPDQRFTYDAVGRQLTATNSVGAVRTTFDALGRIVSRADAAGRTLGFTYDAGGNRTRMSLPGGANVDYGYDPADRLTRLTSSLGVVQMTYDGDDRLTQTIRPNGTRATSTFDAADQLTTETTTSNAKVVASFGYEYDAVGSVARRVQTMVGTSATNYTYDALRRLTRSVDGAHANDAVPAPYGFGPLLPSTYTYDAAGNRLMWAAPDDPTTVVPNDSFVQTNAFDAASQLVTSRKVRKISGTAVTDVMTNEYDRNGNRRQSDTVAPLPGTSTGTRYGYDAENRLTTQQPVGGVPYRVIDTGRRNRTRSYDALGRLVAERSGTETKTWTSDGLDPLLAGSGASASFYLRGSAGELIGERTPTTGGASWFITDGLGSIMGATDAVALKGPTSYTDYGFNLQASRSVFGFHGELADSILPAGDVVGSNTPLLSHYYARSYDPTLGAWLQRDPVGIAPVAPETMGEYQFVGGNPTSRTDLLGYLSVTNSSPQGTLTVVNSNGSWNGGSLQGSSAATQTLQPTYSPQVTVDGSYLQNTVNPFTLVRRNQAAYGQLAAMGSQGAFSGWSTSGSGFSLDVGDLLGPAYGATEEFAHRRASYLGRELHFGRAGGISFTSAGRLAKNLPVVGAIVDAIEFGGNYAGYRAEGKTEAEALTRASLEAGGSVGGGWAGGQVCLAIGAATAGWGLVTCPVLVFGGSYYGEKAGTNSYDWGSSVIDSAKDKAQEYSSYPWWQVQLRR